MEAARTSENSVYFNETTWRYIPESCRLHICRRKNMQSQILIDWLIGWLISIGWDCVSELLSLTDIVHPPRRQKSMENNSGMIYWQGKTEKLGEKPVPVPLCPPQIPQELTRARTRDSARRARWLTAWAMARSCNLRKTNLFSYFSIYSQNEWVTSVSEIADRNYSRRVRKEADCLGHYATQVHDLCR
jgi:hypothetical protein